MDIFQLVMLKAWALAVERPRRRGRENGDVPGWVMITILSAVLVVGLIGIAGPQLQKLFTNATDGVANTKSP